MVSSYDEYIKIYMFKYVLKQGSGFAPYELISKEKEYLLLIPSMNVLTGYLSRQEEKTYVVNKESMIRYEGRKYSEPTRHIGERMTVTTDNNDNLSIYYK